MNLFGYEFRFSNHAKRSWNDLKVFKKTSHTHIVWFKFSLIYGPKAFCEECNERTEIGLTLCDECYSDLYCECGSALETKGEGMCSRCD